MSQRVTNSAELIAAINARRAHMDMSAYEVAQRAERTSGLVTTAYGAQVLNHPNKAPQFDTLAALADAAGLDILVRPR